MRVVDRFVDLLLRHRQDAVVVRADVRRAHAHRALRRRSVGDELDAADADPLVAEPGIDVGGLEAVERFGRADHHVRAVRQLAVLPAVLVGEDVLGVGSGVVDRGEAAGAEQLRHVTHAVAGAIAALFGREGLALADPVEYASRVLRDATGQLAVLPEEPAIGRIGRVVRDARELERLAVVPTRMAAAVRDDDGMFRGRFVEIFLRQRPIQLRVVELEAIDPQAGRGGLRLPANRGLYLAHRLHVRVDAVQLLHAAWMAVTIDEPRRHEHLLRVDHARARRRDVANLARRSDRDETAVLHGERFCARARRIAREHARVDDDEIGLDARTCRGGRLLRRNRPS